MEQVKDPSSSTFQYDFGNNPQLDELVALLEAHRLGDLSDTTFYTGLAVLDLQSNFFILPSRNIYGIDYIEFGRDGSQLLLTAVKDRSNTISCYKGQLLLSKGVIEISKLTHTLKVLNDNNQIVYGRESITDRNVMGFMLDRFLSENLSRFVTLVEE